MGNYSYLLKILYGNNTSIDIEELRKECDEINKEYKDYYLYCIHETDDLHSKVPVINTFEDFAKCIDGHKLCGYLTNGYIKKLCRAGVHMRNNEGKNPIMYFDEEGWDRIHYFKFFPGTEKVEHGTYAFNFDHDYYEKEYMSKEELNKNNKLSKLKKVFDILAKKDKDTYDENKYEYASSKRTNYINNLIYDTSTKWNVNILDYNIKQLSDTHPSVLLSLFGIRIEDMINEPEKYNGIIKDLIKLKL